jgi:hypothetical protein
MTVLHEILAAEKTVTNARDQLHEDTRSKFGKAENYFTGHIKTLTMLGDTQENKAIEEAARSEKELPTTVVTTLDYFLKFWAKAEDTLSLKNATNTKATADLVFRNEVVAKDIPVDELMGLEARLTDLRKLFVSIPTLDASKAWAVSTTAAAAGTWITTTPSVTTRTEKIMTPVVLYPATDHHPAQVEKVSTDKVIGTFETITTSGATTAIQKANVLAVVDDLITAVKQARIRANHVETVSAARLGTILKDLMLEPLLRAPVSNAV